MERTQAGLERAKAGGKKLSRASSLAGYQRKAVRQRLAAGASVSGLARNSTRPA